MARELSIIYGGLTVGGASTVYKLDGTPTMRMSRDYRRTTVEAEVTVVTPDGAEGTFATNVAALEAALRTPRARLQVKLGSSTLLDLDPATGTGYNADPSASKPGGAPGTVPDTGRSRKYHLSVTVE